MPIVHSFVNVSVVVCSSFKGVAPNGIMRIPAINMRNNRSMKNIQLWDIPASVELVTETSTPVTNQEWVSSAGEAPCVDDTPKKGDT